MCIYNIKFTLDVPGPNDYEIDGSFWQHEFEFKRSGRSVATVSKSYWDWTDSYGVNIVGGEDDVAILTIVALLDLMGVFYMVAGDTPSIR